MFSSTGVSTIEGGATDGKDDGHAACSEVPRTPEWGTGAPNSPLDESVAEQAARNNTETGTCDSTPSCGGSEREDAETLLAEKFPLWFLFPTMLLHPALQEAMIRCVAPLRRQLRRAAALRVDLLDAACAESSRRSGSGAEPLSSEHNVFSPSVERVHQPLVLFKSDAAKIVKTLNDAFNELSVKFPWQDGTPATEPTVFDVVVENYKLQHSGFSDESSVAPPLEASSSLQARVLCTVSEELQFNQGLTASLLEALIEADCMLAEARGREQELRRQIASLRRQVGGAEKRCHELEVSFKETLAATHRRFGAKEARWINTVAHLRKSLDHCKAPTRQLE